MAGINIPFLANVRDFLRGTGDVEDAVDDVADSLDGLARDATAASSTAERALAGVGDAGADVGTEMKDAGRTAERALDDVGTAAERAGREIETELEAGAREAGDASEKMERSFRDAFKTVSQKAKESGDDVARETRRGSAQAESAVGEFKDEARSNFSEVASSFTGDMDSAADLVQGTFGGLAGSLGGPLGLALGGLGAAAGVFYTKWKENAEKTEARVESMYDDMLASGQSFLSQDYIQGEFHKIVKGADDAIKKYEDLALVAGLTGLTQQEAALAYAGNTELMTRLVDGLRAAEEDRYAAAGDLSKDEAARQDYRIQMIRDEIAAARERQGEIEKTAATYTDAAATLENYTAVGADALADLRQAEIDHAQAVRDARKAIAENGAAVGTSTEKGRLNEAALLDQLDATRKLTDALDTSGGTAAEVRAKQEKLADQFVTSAERAGYAGDKAIALAEAYGLVPSEVKTEAVLSGVRAAERELAPLLDPKRIPMRVDLSDAKREVASWRPSVILNVHPRNGKQIR